MVTKKKKDGLYFANNNVHNDKLGSFNYSMAMEMPRWVPRKSQQIMQLYLRI